jgi:hypothetical protein
LLVDTGGKATIDRADGKKAQGDTAAERDSSEEGVTTISSPVATNRPPENNSEVASTYRNATSAGVQPTAPGAVAVGGSDTESVDDEPTLPSEPPSDVENSASSTTENPTDPVTARLVHENEDDYELLQQELRNRDAELEQIRREAQNVAMAEVIVEAEDAPERDDESLKGMQRLVKNPRNQWIALTVGILVIVGVVLGVVLPRESSPEGPTPTASPTMPPTSPIVLLTELLSDVSTDGGEALQTPSTAQNEALNWLAGNANLDSYADEKKIQRYVLATLFYSLNGNSWTNNNGWLTDSDECDWYNQADDGPFCTVDGGVRELDFFQNNLDGTIPPEVGLLSDSLGKHRTLVSLSIYLIHLLMVLIASSLSLLS